MKKILIAYDGSEAAKKAIDVGMKCAQEEDSIVLLTVVPAELVESSFTKMLLPMIDMSSVVQTGSFKEKAMESLSQLAHDMEINGNQVRVDVEIGDPADEILLAAKTNDVDLIVVGYKGYGKEGRFLLGSATDKVVRYAGVSVLVVR
jgi:nucleotide-binding universal stress UspA family protein